MPDPTDFDTAFDAAPEAVLRPLLTACLAVPRWVDALLAARPHGSPAALVAAADAIALSDDEVRAALAGHPRLGEREPGSDPSARWSADEQRDVEADDRLAAANRAYEERFGHRYLVCATGMTGADVRADLTARLANPPGVELRVVARELARIAALRLRKAWP
ncbi:2-oxo-4-hydroxy-4-carboxy-5-ureidoimidazoline decarboxylase [Actinosynnema sp. NPDC020468]|uniref:2-oxo-4-hydroxy-4-carboxy-5-ureidoimidazoline decarboxylase n=1 Tax=Actinosynnema sp. NPDC020468 TaxID=3154488 RepID=UPI0033EEA45D